MSLILRELKEVSDTDVDWLTASINESNSLRGVERLKICL